MPTGPSERPACAARSARGGAGPSVGGEGGLARLARALAGSHPSEEARQLLVRPSRGFGGQRSAGERARKGSGRGQPGPWRAERAGLGRAAGASVGRRAAGEERTHRAHALEARVDALQAGVEEEGHARAGVGRLAGPTRGCSARSLRTSSRSTRAVSWPSRQRWRMPLGAVVVDGHVAARSAIARCAKEGLRGGSRSSGHGRRRGRKRCSAPGVTMGSYRPREEVALAGAGERSGPHRSGLSALPVTGARERSACTGAGERSGTRQAWSGGWQSSGGGEPLRRCVRATRRRCDAFARQPPRRRDSCAGAGSRTPWSSSPAPRKEAVRNPSS